MPNLIIAQDELDKWTKHNFPNATSWQQLLGVVEEVGELCHAHLKGEQGIRHSPEEVRALKKDAIGDICIFMMNYCSMEGMWFYDCIAEAWEEVKQRDWRNDAKSGSQESSEAVPGSILDAQT